MLLEHIIQCNIDDMTQHTIVDSMILKYAKEDRVPTSILKPWLF